MEKINTTRKAFLIFCLKIEPEMRETLKEGNEKEDMKMLQLPLCMVFSTTPFNALEFCDEEKAFFMGTHPGSKSVLMCFVTSVSLTESQWSAGTFCFSALAS